MTDPGSGSLSLCFSPPRGSVADASFSSCGIDRARRPHAPLRNGAGDQSSAIKVAMADDDDVVYPLTGNDDRIAAGLVSEDDDDIHDDAAVLLGIDVGSGSAPIDLDGGDGGGGVEPAPSTTATGTPIGSNSTDGTSYLGKRKSGV